MRKNQFKIILTDADPQALVKAFTKSGLISLLRKRRFVSYWEYKALWRLRKLDLAEMILEAK